jgi:hypothetical protein
LLTCRGGSSGIAGWTVSNNGDVAFISIVVAVAVRLQQYWLQEWLEGYSYREKMKELILVQNYMLE